MTSEDDARLRVLSKLLAEERDPEKVKVLADELGRLLTLPPAVQLPPPPPGAIG